MPALVVGKSMQPTLRPGELVLVNKLAFLWRDPVRGEVVCVRTRRGHMIKRVIGLPGERIALRNGQLMVDNVPVSEAAYLVAAGKVEVATGRLPPSGFGVIGDNRADTIVAVVSRSRIVGKLMYPPPPTAQRQRTAAANQNSAPRG